MVVTRGSNSKEGEQQDKKETSLPMTGEPHGTEGGSGEGGAPGGQSETLGFLIKTVENISKTLMDQVEHSNVLAGQVARLSTLLEGRRSTEADAEATGVSVTQQFLSPPPTSSDTVAPHEALAVPPTRHFAKPQDYDGSVPWLAFRTQFEAIASIHGWSDRECLGELVACLRGPALEVFAHLPPADQNDYARLLTTLEQRFGCGKQEAWFRTQFRRRRRSPGESLSSLARDIEKLAFQAYPDAPRELRDSLACDQFLDALGDVDLQISVRQSRPAGLQDAVTGAVEIEAIRRSVKATHGEPHSSAGFAARQAVGNRDANVRDGNAEDFEHRLKALENSLKAVQTQRGSASSRRGSAEEVECWSCGERGHVRRSCPKRSRLQRHGDTEASHYQQRPGNGK